MQDALVGVTEPIDYLNTHGTSTPVGDLAEMRAVRKVFGRDMPLISSTKSLSGHALGAAGVHEVIYCLLMMRENFIAASANIDNLDPELTDMPVLRETRENVTLNTIMSNSFGFGGTNATLVLKRWQGE
jgi:3-oxoacyl-[acyl-carrier-protein] synthase-1